jgi:hypothetical protein
MKARSRKMPDGTSGLRERCSTSRKAMLAFAVVGTVVFGHRPHLGASVRRVIARFCASYHTLRADTYGNLQQFMVTSNNQLLNIDEGVTTGLA